MGRGVRASFRYMISRYSRYMVSRYSRFRIWKATADVKMQTSAVLKLPGVHPSNQPALDISLASPSHPRRVAFLPANSVANLKDAKLSRIIFFGKESYPLETLL